MTIRANGAISGLIASDRSAHADVFVDLAGPCGTIPRSVGRWTRRYERDYADNSSLDVWGRRERPGTSFRLRFSREERFVEVCISADARQARVHWSGEVSDGAVWALVRSPVLGLLARLRGALCLHTAVVDIDRAAIAVAGASGAGKTTTAAALLKRGYSLMSDDIAALTTDGGPYFAQPGYPCMRIWPSAAAALPIPTNDLPRVRPGADKRYLELSTDGSSDLRFQPHPRPLAAVYVLGPRNPSISRPRIQRLTAIESVVALAHDIPGRFVADKAMRARELRSLAQLSMRVPVRRLERPDALGQLGACCDAILADVRAERELARPSG